MGSYYNTYYKMNKQKNNKRFIKPCAKINMIYGVLGSIFLLVRFLHSSNVINLLSNNIVYNTFMISQLVLLALGITSAVYAGKAKQNNYPIWYYVCFAVAGMNTTVLLFMGVVTIFTPFNFIGGYLILQTTKAPTKEDTEDDFGGTAEGISETTKSTVSVIDSLQTQEDKEK